jgi:RNA polymerase sigma factor (sigma-70 family)
MEASRAATESRRTRTSLRQQLAIFRRPNDRAFEQLYKRHAREVYQYALALLANPADAEDVTQTTFLNAYRAFEKGERPEKPHNWLIAITHNVCRMRWRQAGSRPREVALDEAPEPPAPDDEQPDLDEVLTALAALSFNQRAAIVMRELEGRSYQEIAGVLGISVSAVEALLFRARTNLKIKRRALGVLTTVPLPGQLASFIGGSGGAAVAGSAAVGIDLALKAASVVAVGAATAGVGLMSAQALTAPHTAASAEAAVVKPAAKAHQASVAKTKALRQTATRHAALRRAVAVARASRVSRPTGPSSGSIAPSSGSLPGSESTAAAPTPSASASASALAPAPAAAPVSLPTPQLPPPPVAIPQLPPPPIAIPPLPVLPPLPPLPPTPPVNLPPPPPLPPVPPPPPIK